MLPFTLGIFHNDLNDSKKTYALVDKIEVQKKDLKGRLKRGDKVIAINEHRFEDKTYKEVQQIIHQLNPQQQFKLTIERRQWRQVGEQNAEGASKNFHDAEAQHTFACPRQLPSALAICVTTQGAALAPRRDDIQESACTPSSEPRDTPTDQTYLFCQNCLTITIPDKREQAIT
ncbi:hypothetical protein OS493_030813 [Desmophyllum pertusum]|uniref:PDZ domain-containing protein n=1 Tax=Desmophyllum pertusum TaxID=174260 RepID=A0A9W9YJN8_9CNID|nr:hypothetical protein OS493_030813 [Desmophyllum pertusum]